MAAQLRQLLVAEPADAGCAAACAAVERYAELAQSGGDAELAFPGVAAHHRACPACTADYRGLLEAMRRADGKKPPSGEH